MRKRLLVSVATAALFTTGFAFAQGMNQGGAKGEAPAATAPRGESGGAANSSMSREPSGSQAKESTTPRPGSSAEDRGGKALPQQAQDKAGPATDKKSGPTAEDKGGSKVMPQQAQDKGGAEVDKKSSTQTSGEMNKDSKSKSSSDTTSTGGAKTSTENSPAGTAKGSPTADSKAGSTNTESRTTGNAATSATAAPPAEKQTQIASAIKQERVEEVTNVNFNISVGATVPASVRFHPLPARIVEIYPEWRGYDFIVVHGRYVILRPRTHEIVYIIEG